jgi:hypothetical protein
MSVATEFYGTRKAPAEEDRSAKPVHPFDVCPLVTCGTCDRLFHTGGTDAALPRAQWRPELAQCTEMAEHTVRLDERHWCVCHPAARAAFLATAGERSPYEVPLSMQIARAQAADRAERRSA